MSACRTRRRQTGTQRWGGGDWEPKGNSDTCRVPRAEVMVPSPGSLGAQDLLSEGAAVPAQGKGCYEQGEAPAARQSTRAVCTRAAMFPPCTWSWSGETSGDLKQLWTSWGWFQGSGWALSARDKSSQPGQCPWAVYTCSGLCRLQEAASRT